VIVSVVPGRPRSHEARVRVPQKLADRQHRALVSAALPHFDRRLAERVSAHEPRLGMKILEVAADRHCFAHAGSVIELERRRGRIRIEAGDELGLQMKLPGDADLLDRNRDALLGEEHLHAARIRCEVPIVDFHSTAISRAGARFSRVRACR